MTEKYKTTPHCVGILRSWSNKIIEYAKSSFLTQETAYSLHQMYRALS